MNLIGRGMQQLLDFRIALVLYDMFANQATWPLPALDIVISAGESAISTELRQQSHDNYLLQDCAADLSRQRRRIYRSILLCFLFVLRAL